MIRRYLPLTTNLFPSQSQSQSQSSGRVVADATLASLSYVPSSSSIDEAVDAYGKIRPHWEAYFRATDELGSEDLTRRWRDAQHLIRENGVTYNVYGDPHGMTRPWQLDPIPLLISQHESTLLEVGLIQRAKLLETICADLYGEQKLIHSGLIPPELLFANPGFLRPCQGVPLPANRHLHLYAANLGRDGDGNFRVLSDRTQAPSGAGYTLENRIVLSRALPEAFRDCRVQRLATFFRSLRETLNSIAPRNKDNPRTVLLTPGPYNETYFEHAYLARYLGYTLVEGGDLTVRDNRVFLKVLGGLQPVDVIFRRLDDDFCDPLELRPDSFLGVPGLVQAVRAGTVAVANALGTGVLETPALLAFLPRLCRELLGEDLRIPSVTTWWCGEPSSLSHVLANIETMAIKPAFPTARMDPIFCEDLAIEDRAKLIARIRAKPRDYVGLERVNLSTTPVLVGENLVPRKMVMRTYLAADGDTFSVMPGGLTRVSSSADTPIVSMQRGGGSKDTWILSSGPVSSFSMLPQGAMPIELTRAGGDLPSRVADNLFWLGRYAERAEGTTRLLRAVVARLADKSGLADVPELPALLRALTFQTDTLPGFIGEGAAVRLTDPDPEVLSLVFDHTKAGSLASVLEAFLRVAGMVRDRISVDMWRIVNGLNEYARRPETEELTLGEVLELLNRSVITLAAFSGLVVESMTRGEGWRFLNIGRKLERAVNVVSLLRGTLLTSTPQEGPVLDAVLEVADSGMTYRRRYLGSLRVEGVLDLLVCDETNPRSLATQLSAIVEDVDRLPRPTPVGSRDIDQRLALTAFSAVQLADVGKLAKVHQRTRPALVALLEQLKTDLPILSDTITLKYLSHLQTSRHLAGDFLQFNTARKP